MAVANSQIRDGDRKLGTQKTQKYLALIFVFFVYAFWASRSKTDLSELLPPGSKKRSQNAQNPDHEFLRVLRTHVRTRIRNNTTKAFFQRSERRHSPNKLNDDSY